MADNTTNLSRASGLVNEARDHVDRATSYEGYLKGAMTAVGGYALSGIGAVKAGSKAIEKVLGPLGGAGAGYTLTKSIEDSLPDGFYSGRAKENAELLDRVISSLPEDTGQAIAPSKETELQDIVTAMDRVGVGFDRRDGHFSTYHDGIVGPVDNKSRISAVAFAVRFLTALV